MRHTVQADRSCYFSAMSLDEEGLDVALVTQPTDSTEQIKILEALARETTTD